MADLTPFIPGEGISRPGPLARYLPPVQEGIATGWLVERAPPGSWVLDPFGVCPGMAVEMARAGYRVIVSANNPILRLLLELEANPPGQKELSAALAALAAIPKGSERLEQSMLSIYHTACAHCGETIIASSFLWDRGADAPHGKIYRCPHCGDEGERTCNEADKKAAAQYTRKGLHWARAIERITPPNDPDRPLVEEIMEMYLPRAIHVLITLVNQLDRLPMPQRLHFIALLISVLDQGNKLWPHPTQRAHPRQLAIPARFREVNLWMALEEAVKRAGAQEAVSPGSVLPCLSWPDLPPATGGLTIFEGRFKELTENGDFRNNPRVKVAAIVSALPRPNQAFWTLSVLWTGWLFTHEATARIKGLVRRRRYDWAWHSIALHQAFEALIKSLPQTAPFLGLIGEAEPGFLNASLLAAECAGYALHGMALRAETGEAQITWNIPQQRRPVQASNELQWRLEIEKAATQYLQERGEPGLYLQVFAAALCRLIQTQTFAQSKEEPLSEIMGKLNHAIQQSIARSRRLAHVGGSETSLDSGVWTLAEGIRPVKKPSAGIITLADRVEISFTNLFLQRQQWTRRDLDRQLCLIFPGLLTPNPQLVQLCLESYAEPPATDRAAWTLRASDRLAERKKDLSEILRLLAELGARLGYTPHRPLDEETVLLWCNEHDDISYRFFILVTAALGNTLLSHQDEGGEKILVCPGSRSRLLQYKLQQNLHLRQIVDQGWHFIKFRHVRWLAENPDIAAATFDQQLELDPLQNTDPQLIMF